MHTGMCVDQRLRKLQLCSFAASNENCTGVSWAWLHVKVRLHVALVRVQLNAHRVSAEVTCLDAVLFSRRKGRDKHRQRYILWVLEIISHRQDSFHPTVPIRCIAIPPCLVAHGEILWLQLPAESFIQSGSAPSVCSSAVNRRA